MQRIGDLKKKFLSFGNLYSAWKKAFKSTKSYEAYEYSFQLENNLYKLQKELASSTYIPGEYHYFIVTDPKERIISVASFRDRIVHHALINILELIYEKRFIHHSYATRKSKGTHRAIVQAQMYLRKNRWYLKMDIAKYFNNIDHEILYQLLSRKIKDKFILLLCRKIMTKGGDGKCGLPIGNLTSQFWANVYLDRFDHLVKDQMKIKSYLRYMDDFCLFSNRKKDLKDILLVLEVFLLSELKLRIKPQATSINSSLHGLPFLGVRIFPSLIRVRSENFKRSLKRIRLREYEYETGKIKYERYLSSMMSLISHLKYWNSWELLKKEILVIY